MADTLVRLDEITAQQPVEEQQQSGLVRLGDLASEQRPIPDEEVSQFDLSGFINVSDKQRAEWKKLGPIGYIEAAQRADKGELIPFNPFPTVKVFKLKNAVDRLRADLDGKPTYEGRPGQKSQDLIKVNNFLAKAAEEQERGFTVGGRIAGGINALPSFMIEFLATGGLASLGKKGVQKGAQKVLGKAAENAVAKVTTRVAGATAGSVLRTTAQAPTRVSKQFAERRINSVLELTDEGFKLADESNEKPMVSFAKAFGDVTIENLSEVAGPAIGQTILKPVSRAAQHIFPKRFANGLIKMHQKLRPGQDVKQLLTKTGYNNFIEEIGEERLGDLLRAATGVEDFGQPDGNVLDRLWASIPDGEDFLVEVGVLAVPGGVGVVTQRVADAVDRQRGKVSEIPDKVIDQIAIEKETEQESKKLPAIPEFKSTEEAVSFGESIKENKQAIASIKQQQEENKRRKEELAQIENPTPEQQQELFDEIVRGQFLREALQRAEQTESAETQKLSDQFIERQRQEELKEETEISKEQKLIESEVEVSQRIGQKLRDIDLRFKTKAPKVKAEAKLVQNELIKEIERSNLPAQAKKQFIRTIKNVQTAQQLPAALLNIRERIRVMEEKAAKRLEINKFKKLTQKKRLRKLRSEFLEPIEELIQDITATKPSAKKLSQLKSLVEFLEREEENQIPQEKLNELRKLDQKSLPELTLQELQDINSSIAHLIKLNELKNKIILGNKLKDFGVALEEAIENVKEQSEGFNESLDGLDSFQTEREASLWKKIFGADSYNAELKTQILDGKDGGIIQQILYKEIDGGVAKELDFLHKAEDFFKNKLKDIDVSIWSTAFQLIKKKDIDKGKAEQKVVRFTIRIPSSSKPIKMTKGELLAFLLHTRNENNLRHLVEGGFSFSNTPSKIVRLDEGDISTIIEVAERDPDVSKVADAISEYLNTVQKDAINEVSVDINGHDIAVEPNYFPIRTSFLDRIRQEGLRKGGFAKITLEGLGIFKQRQRAQNAIILDDAFVATYKSIKQVSAYVGLAKPLIGAKALLFDNSFEIAIRESGRLNYLQSLRRYIEQIEGEAIRTDNVDRLTQEFINKLDVAILGLNPFVMAKQPVSYLGAATEMNFKDLTSSFKFIPSQQEVNEMMKFSPHLRDRLEGNVTREVGEISEVGRPKRFFTGEEVVSNRFMEGIRRFDLAAIASIWRAVKKEVQRSNPNLEGDAFFEKVAERAWEVIRRTQPTFHIKDRSTIGASRNVFTRLLTKYSSQRNKNWMMIRRALEKYNKSFKTPKDKAELAKSLALINILAPLLLMSIDFLRDELFDRRKKEGLFKDAFTDFVSINFGNIYFFGPAVDSLFSKIERGTWAGYDINDPVRSTMNDIVDSVAEAIITVEQAISGEKYKTGRKKGEEKWRTSLKRFTEKSLDTAGKLKGVPIAPVRRFIEGVNKQTAKFFSKEDEDKDKRLKVQPRDQKNARSTKGPRKKNKKDES